MLGWSGDQAWFTMALGAQAAAAMPFLPVP